MLAFLLASFGFVEFFYILLERSEEIHQHMVFLLSPIIRSMTVVTIYFLSLKVILTYSHCIHAWMYVWKMSDNIHTSGQNCIAGLRTGFWKYFTLLLAKMSQLSQIKKTQGRSNKQLGIDLPCRKLCKYSSTLKTQPSLIPTHQGEEQRAYR